MKVTALLLAILISVGCSSTGRKITKTGLFSDNLDILLENFKKVENGKTNLNDFGVMGFNLRARNVDYFQGVPAFKEIYGQEAFRNFDPNNLTKMLPELNRYTLYRIPFKDINIVSDRFYFSTKETVKTGDDVTLSIVTMDDNTIIYHAIQHIRVDELEVDYAFASGLLVILKDVIGPTQATKDLLDGLKSKD